MKKAVDTLSLVTSALALFKTLGVVFTMAMLEWARKRAQKAEDRQAVAQAELKIKNYRDRLNEKYKNRTANDIIQSYLDSQK